MTAIKAKKMMLKKAKQQQLLDIIDGPAIIPEHAKNVRIRPMRLGEAMRFGSTDLVVFYREFNKPRVVHVYRADDELTRMIVRFT